LRLYAFLCHFLMKMRLKNIKKSLILGENLRICALSTHCKFERDRVRAQGLLLVASPCSPWTCVFSMGSIVKYTYEQSTYIIIKCL
jgi:hypothetical protein